MSNPQKGEAENPQNTVVRPINAVPFPCGSHYIQRNSFFFYLMHVTCICSDMITSWKLDYIISDFNCICLSITATNLLSGNKSGGGKQERERARIFATTQERELVTRCFKALWPSLKKMSINELLHHVICLFRHWY